ncbi:hypothetical protein BGZ76_002839, partial [Entomortierella beljakovae]
MDIGLSYMEDRTITAWLGYDASDDASDSFHSVSVEGPRSQGLSSAVCFHEKRLLESSLGDQVLMILYPKENLLNVLRNKSAEIASQSAIWGRKVRELNPLVARQRGPKFCQTVEDLEVANFDLKKP